MKISMAVCRMSPRVTSARKSDRTASELGNKLLGTSLQSKMAGEVGRTLSRLKPCLIYHRQKRDCIEFFLIQVRIYCVKSSFYLDRSNRLTLYNRAKRITGQTCYVSGYASRFLCDCISFSIHPFVVLCTIHLLIDP